MTSKHSSAKRLLVTGLFDDLQTFADIESRISAIFGNKERGDDFEIFAEADLATQKIAQARPMSGLAACEEAPTYRLHAVTRDGG